MKKQTKKLELNRETLHLLEIDAKKLARIHGGDIATCNAMASGCFSCVS